MQRIKREVGVDANVHRFQNRDSPASDLTIAHSSVTATLSAVAQWLEMKASTAADLRSVTDCVHCSEKLDVLRNTMMRGISRTEGATREDVSAYNTRLKTPTSYAASKTRVGCAHERKQSAHAEKKKALTALDVEDARRICSELHDLFRRCHR